MDITNLSSQPSSIQSYIAQRARAYKINPQALFDKIPNHLKDNPKEIMDYLSVRHGDVIGMEVSHINSQYHAPNLKNNPNNILLETTEGHPNQVRGSHDMNLTEAQKVIDEANQRALRVDAAHPEDNYINSYTSTGHYTSSYEKVHNLALANNYESLADAIHNALQGIAHTAGLALSYSVARVYIPKIIALVQFIIKYRNKLIESPELRQKLVDDYVIPMIKTAPNEIGPAFMVGLLLVCIPGIKALLLAYGLTALCKLALEHIQKFVLYIERYVPNLARMLHWVISGGQKLIDAINCLLKDIWAIVEKVAAAAWNPVKAGIQYVGKVAKDCLSSIFNWGLDRINQMFYNQKSLSYA